MNGDVKRVVVVMGGRGSGKTLLMLAALEAFRESCEKIGTSVVIVDELAHISDANSLAIGSPRRVLSDGRHGGGKGRKAHKKNALKFGAGWQ